MGKRPAETESFEGNMSVMQWTREGLLCKEENRLSWKRDSNG